MISKLSLAFAAGALGGLATALTIWLFGVIGISQAAGVSIAPSLGPAFLYGPIIWGGIWGWIFLTPIGAGLPLLVRGLLLSLGPSLVQCFIVFPFKLDAGFLGLAVGTLTPLFVLVFNAVWGLVTAATLQAQGTTLPTGNRL
jgi:hypothetical protein